MTDYGPQSTEVEALIERLGRLTPNEIQSLATAWAAARDAPRVAARAAAWDVAWVAAGVAVRDAVRAAARDAARDAAWDAALALACRHLIGDTFTWEHYRTLVWPAATVLGPVHPDD